MKFWTWANRVLYFALMVGTVTFAWLKATHHPLWAALVLLLMVTLFVALLFTVVAYHCARRTQRATRTAVQRIRYHETIAQPTDDHVYAWADRYHGVPIKSFPAGLID